MPRVEKRQGSGGSRARAKPRPKPYTARTASARRSSARPASVGKSTPRAAATRRKPRRAPAPAPVSPTDAGQAVAADAILIICFAAAVFIALALAVPGFSKPAGELARDGLRTSLGLGMYFVPFALLLLPGALLHNAKQGLLIRAWVWVLCLAVLASLGGGLFPAQGWGGLLGDSTATLGRRYLGSFYPTLLLVLTLLVIARLAGRALILPLMHKLYGAAVTTGGAVADMRAAVAEDAQARAELRREQRAQAGNGESAQRERRRQVLAAELEAADAPEGESPLVRAQLTPPAVAQPASALPAAVAPDEIPAVHLLRDARPQTVKSVEIESQTPAQPIAPVVVQLPIAEQPPADDAFAAVVNAASAGQIEPDPYLAEQAKTLREADSVAGVMPLGAGQLKLFSSTLTGYELPPLTLLRDAPLSGGEERYLEQRAQIIERTLQSFGIEASVQNTVVGPRVTRYEIRIGPGINVSRIHSLADNLALELAVKAIRIEAPVPGLSAVGIEVPNAAPQLVSLKSVLEAPLYRSQNHPLTVGLGRDIAGEPVVANLAKMPHVLVAGATGSGKSVCLNALIVSLLYRNAPDTLRFILIDPKRVEMTCYADLPHLACPVVHDVNEAQSALKWAVAEMERRYRLLEVARARNIAVYNEQAASGEQLPFIVVVIDELADLMMLAGQVIEKLVCRIAQLSRAVGIHLVIATQRPDVKVITGTIKANIPSRVAFAVVSQIDSRTILDGGGAEKLLGSGDMLFSPIGENQPVRVQGCYLADDEIDRVVAWCRGQAKAAYDESITRFQLDDNAGGGGGADGQDEMFTEACEIVQGSGRASISYLQRRLKIGYNRAASLMERLEDAGIVSAPDSQGNRKVL